MSNTILDSLIGRSAASAYGSILLTCEDVNRASVFRYTSPPTLQQRIVVTALEQQIIDRALQLRDQAKIPFWQAIFSACILEGRCSKALLDATFFHQGQGTCIEYERRDIASGILESLTADGRDNVALGSVVQLKDGTFRHLHLLDFHCDISDENTRLVHAVCRELMPSGFVLVDSGDSYHAASVVLTTAAARIELLGKALLVSPIVDAVYIAHQLQQSSSSIRISRGGKMKQVPMVIDAWCPGTP